MSVIEESGNNVRNHYIIKLVEFFEFIARSAAQKYGGPENINKKIEDLLDIILPMFNQKRITVGGIVNQEDSDESVMFDD